MINIFLYTDSPSKSFDINKFISFLESFNFKTENRGDFLSFLELSDKDFKQYNSFLDSIEIHDIEMPLGGLSSDAVNPEFNKSFTKENFIDGYWLQRKWYSYLSAKSGGEINETNLHLIISGKLIGTFGTRRYHARVLLTGDPAVISTSGIVEAPARPREYHYIKARLLSIGKETDELDEMYRDRFVKYDDPKLTKILSSYALQQIKGKITGEPFCKNSACCLYNSHWQEEVLALQYENVMCDECRKILNRD